MPQSALVPYIDRPSIFSYVGDNTRIRILNNISKSNYVADVRIPKLSTSCKHVPTAKKKKENSSFHPFHSVTTNCP